MTSDRRSYSDQMARRIRCLRIGSFDCLVRGGVFNEEEAHAVLPYLEIRYSTEGFCIACVHARRARNEVGWVPEDEPAPGESAARALRVRIGSKGFVYHRQDEGDIVVFWTSTKSNGYAELLEIFAAASNELESRHRIALTYALGGWRTDLVDARGSLDEAQRLLSRGGDPPHLMAAGDEARWIRDIAGYSDEHVGLCANEPVRSIQTYILEHFRDPSLALSSIASRFRLTETYLSQLFKEHTGLNYSVFLERNRVEEARRLLEQSELSISEVGSCVGYQINSTFYRAFRRMYGVSPTTFRNELRGRARSERQANGHAVAV